MSTWAILLAGGSSRRMGSNQNKVLLPLCGEYALCRSLRTLQEYCSGVVLVVRPEDKEEVQKALAGSRLSADAIVCGGDTRQASVAKGIRALPLECDIVLVHDGARPLLDGNTVKNVIEGVRAYGSAIASTPVTDTIHVTDSEKRLASTPERESLRAVQTPQGFRRDWLERAHNECTGVYSDDAALVAALGHPIHLVEGSRNNLKLTTPEDIRQAMLLLSGLPRVGHGYDAHRLVEDRKLILGGVEIPYEKGLLGHSDADVLVHAIIDALFGAAAMGDIGQHFPDRDPQYKGISSLLLLDETRRILTEQGYAILNVDATLIAQRPKLASFIPDMRKRIADMLRVDIDAVSVKATTTEGMGFEGSGEGISAHAVAMLTK